jgi:DNA-binding MarR family transcriptional regulator
MWRTMTEMARTSSSDPDALLPDLERLARVLVAVTAVAIETEPAARGLTVQQWRIHVLLAGAGALRLRDVALGLHASQPSASRLVRPLERTGLVERVPAPDDGRGILVRLTGDGLATHDAVVARRRLMLASAVRAMAMPAGNGLNLHAVVAALEGLI